MKSQSEKPALRRATPQHSSEAAPAENAVEWRRVEVPVWMENPAQRSTRHPMRLGLPFKRGSVFAACRVELRMAGGKRAEEVTMQSRPTAFWPDGSVRWLLLDFVSPPLDCGRTDWLISVMPARNLQDRVETESASMAPENSAKVFIQTATFLVNQEGLSIENTQGVPSGFAQYVLEEPRGKECFVEFGGEVQLELAGPVCSTVFLEGNQVGLNVRLRATFYHELGWVCLRSTIHNPRRAHHPGGLWDLGDAGSRFIRSWKLRFTLPEVAQGPSSPRHRVCWKAVPEQVTWVESDGVRLYQDSSGGENWSSAVHANRSGRVPCQFRGYRVEHGNVKSAGERANPTVSVGHGGKALTVAVPEFWRQFPLSLASEKNTIEVGLFPAEWSDLFELQGGEQKTHTVWFQLQASQAAQQEAKELGLDEFSAAIHSPAIAGCDPAWYAQADAMPQLASAGEANFHPECQQILRQALDGEQSLWAKREASDEYGWRNYGDVWADHEQAYYKGEGQVVSHYNNQFDMIAGGLRQGMQSGDPRWWRFVTPLARHVLDIDIYRTTEDRAAYNGGLFWFTDHYFSAATATHRTFSRQNAPKQTGGNERADYGGGPGSEHNFATGLLYYHWMSGDPDAAEGVRLLADWVLAMDDDKWSMWSILDDGPTGLASMCGSLEYQGPGRGSANSIQVLLDAWLLTHDARYMTRCETLIRRVIHPADDIPARDLLNAESRWSYTMFLAALMRYLEVKAEWNEIDESYAYARASLLHYARWMLKHERPYLDHPENLEFPTEAWAAQELRKANVLRLAADYLDLSEREIAVSMRERGNQLAERAWTDLANFSTRQTTRSVAIVMTEGGIDGYLRSGASPPSPPSAEEKYDFGQPQFFVPRKMRLKASLKSPWSWPRLVASLLKPSAWRKAAGWLVMK